MMLSVQDFEMLKQFAVKDGVVNYQVFAESIVHGYLHERLKGDFKMTHQAFV